MALDKNVPLAANQIAADIVAINANWEELMKSSHIYAADAEASDTYVVTLAPAPTAYANGMILNIKVNTANTGACTLNVNALGAIAIKKYHDQDPETGDIEANQILTVVYNSTGPKFQIVSQLASFTGSGAPVRATSPTLVTPALGTPSAGDLTNCTLATPPAIGETTPNIIRGTNKEIFKTASADSPLTAAECAGTIVSNYGMTDADCTIDLPTAVEGLAFVCILPAVRAKFFKLHCPTAQADKIYLLGVAGLDDGNVGVAPGYATGSACSFFTFKASDGGYDWFAIPIFGTWVAS